jgi:hypothetical protein
VNALNTISEVEFLQWGKKTTDYTDFTDFLVWIFSPFATSEKLQMKPISIRVICEICGSSIGYFDIDFGFQVK